MIKVLLFSPTSVGFLAPPILHLVFLGYFLSWKKKSIATWYLIAWQGSSLLLTSSMLIARSLYARPSAYVEWMGGVGSQLLSIIFMVQFAYHFPRKVFVREARIALILSIAIATGLIGLMLIEAVWTTGALLYDFSAYVFGFGDAPLPSLGFSSVDIFDGFNPIAFLWIIMLWGRQAVYFSRNATQQRIHKASHLKCKCAMLWRDFWNPSLKDNTVARTFGLIFLVAVLAALASAFETRHLLPAGSFAAVYLFVWLMLALAYINYATEISTFMAKLVGLSLVPMLAILGFLNLLIASAQENQYETLRQKELTHLNVLLDNQIIDDFPDSVVYIAERPMEGVFSDTYQMHFSRDNTLTAQTLIAQDAKFVSGLQDGNVSIHNALRHEQPWLEWDLVDTDVTHGFQKLHIPDTTRYYRGSFAPQGQHFICYSLVSNGARYEIGYNYTTYRQMHHQRIVPLVYLMLGTSLLHLLVFPHIFKSSLVNPLKRLLHGVWQVNAGDLTVTVPIGTNDEIGHLTQAFNTMVSSLRTLNTDLTAEITERKQAEAEVRALNVTLEDIVETRTRNLRVLYKLSSLASQALPLNDLLVDMLTESMTVLNSTQGAIFLRGTTGEKTTNLRLNTSQGFSSDIVETIQNLPNQSHLFSQIVENQELLLIPSLADDARISDSHYIAHYAHSIEHLGALTLLALPLLAEGDTAGVLALLRPAQQPFTDEDIALVSSIADLMGVMVLREEFQQLAQQTTRLQERQRIARDLHDAVTQSLYGLVTLSEAGQAQLEAAAHDTLPRTFALIGKTVRQALREMRLLIHQLRPSVLQEEGLVGALQSRLAAVEGRSGVQVHLRADAAPQLPQHVETALYGIAQEALNNVLKHAYASSVTVTLKQEQQNLILEIVDDGIGFDSAKSQRGGVGLESMQERATSIGATLSIKSAPGNGTHVKTTLPL